MPTDADYTIADLARLTELSVRTIRYWIAQGLLPASGEAGPGAHYGQGHLDRLRLIKRLQAEYLPNAEIRRRLAPLSDAEVAALAGESGPAADPARPTTSALDYIRQALSVSAPTPPPAAAPSMPIRAYQGAEPPKKAAESHVVQSPADSASADVEAEPPLEPADVWQVTAAAAAPPSAPIAPSRLLRTADAPMGIDSEAAQRAEADARTPAARIPAAAAPAAGSPAQPSAPGGSPAAPALAPALPPAMPAAAIESPQPERSQWERLSLGPNIELHIRRPLSRPEQRRVERLITIARQVLNEGGEG